MSQMKRNLRSEGDSGERGGGERGGRGRQLGLAAGVERSMERRCAAHGARIEESYGYAGDVLPPTVTVSRTQRASFAEKYHHAARRPLAAAASRVDGWCSNQAFSTRFSGA